MVIVRAEFENGYGYWMNGRLPDGNEVSRYLETRARGPPDRHSHLSGRGRRDQKVRSAYRLVLEEAYKAFRPTDEKAALLILHTPLGELAEHPFIAALRSSGHDHLVLASEEPGGEEFLQLVQENYGFTQADPDPPNCSDILRAWRTDGESVSQPDANQTFAVSAYLILEGYVDMLTNTRLAAHRYFQELGMKPD